MFKKCYYNNNNINNSLNLYAGASFMDGLTLNDQQKKQNNYMPQACLFKEALKESSVGTWQISIGREFHRVGAATLNALSPKGSLYYWGQKGVAGLS